MRAGQHWIEYLLEFLNVLSGFDYELGQGIGFNGSRPEKYKRFTRLGLRRFVFYDNYEKTRHPYDDKAIERLIARLKKMDVIEDGRGLGGDEAVALAKSLLRSFSAVEVQRSWYAKSLFPAHESLLFWEATRKGATKRTKVNVPDDVPSDVLDKEVAFDQRNFFARGGEIYYLILSAGTKDQEDLRKMLGNAFKQLLTSRNQSIGELARIIDEIWRSETQIEEADKEGALGYIPDRNCRLYPLMAEDVINLLSSDIDSLEVLDLLAHLICFHLTIYIYHRAHRNSNPSAHAAHTDDGRTCLETCRPILLVDALEDQASKVIRDLSATLFREQEVRILQKARDSVERQMLEWINNDFDSEVLTGNIMSLAQEHYGINNLRKTTRESWDNLFPTLLSQYEEKMIGQQEFIQTIIDQLTKLLLGDFRKNFLTIHRKLAKSAGFVAPRTSANARFVLKGDLLKSLVLSNVEPGGSVNYEDFLRRLYERYGLVIGVNEARESGLTSSQRINGEYYERNKTALLEHMKNAGLAKQYSDATAIVVNHSVR